MLITGAYVVLYSPSVEQFDYRLCVQTHKMLSHRGGQINSALILPQGRQRMIVLLHMKFNSKTSTFNGIRVQGLDQLSFEFNFIRPFATNVQ